MRAWALLGSARYCRTARPRSRSVKALAHPVVCMCRHRDLEALTLLTSAILAPTPCVCECVPCLTPPAPMTCLKITSAHQRIRGRAERGIYLFSCIVIVAPQHRRILGSRAVRTAWPTESSE